MSRYYNFLFWFNVKYSSVCGAKCIPLYFHSVHYMWIQNRRIRERCGCGCECEISYIILCATIVCIKHFLNMLTHLLFSHIWTNHPVIQRFCAHDRNNIQNNIEVELSGIPSFAASCNYKTAKMKHQSACFNLWNWKL